MSENVRHILLSSMGASGARITSYYFEKDSKNAAKNGHKLEATDGRQYVESGFSALALWQLLSNASKKTDSRKAVTSSTQPAAPNRQRQGKQEEPLGAEVPDEIWFLLTPEAKEKAWPGIEAEAREHGVRVVALDIEGGDKANDTSFFLSAVAKNLPPNLRLTLDITQGLRHHAFLFFALALYVSKFRENIISGIWYSRMETENRSDPKPVIDLKPVLDLANWFLAISEFKDTGSLRSISELITDNRLKKKFAELSQEFLTGLPIEAGMTAKRIMEVFEPGVNSTSSGQPQEGIRVADIPLEDKVKELILSEVRPLAGCYSKKEGLELTERELERQAAFVSKYLKSGQDNLAFGFMREWIVTYLLKGSQEKNSWLKLKLRHKVESQLGCLSNLVGLKDEDEPNKKKLSADLIEQGKFWGQVTIVRNSLQHHGMRPEGMPDKLIRKLSCEWENRQKWSELPSFGGGEGTLLICPIGNTAGVLYSSLAYISPQRCLVVCSSQTESSIDEAITQRDWQGEVKKLVMEDPFMGLEEFESLTYEAKEWLFEADEIKANLTGGTSLMGVLVGKLVEHAKRTYQRECRRFVLIDKRPYEEQKARPWVKGELHYIDNEPKQAGGKE